MPTEQVIPTEPHFQAVDAAVDRTVSAFVGKVETMIRKSHPVASDYIVERLMLVLCAEMSKLVDGRITDPGPETLKLSNALADYRDTRVALRGGSS